MSPETKGTVIKQGKDYNADDDDDLFENQDTNQEADSSPSQNDDWGDEGGGKKPKAKFQMSTTMIIFSIVGLIAFAGILVTIGYVQNKNKAERFEEWEAQAEAEVYVFKYTDEEKELLRANGYTGGEIEENEANEINATILIEKAQKSRQEVWDREWKPLQDKTSPAYKELLENTWVGGKDLTYGTDESLYTYHMFTHNGVYRKIPPHGNQLFVVVELKDGSNVFMSVSPQRYTALDDTGNMVIDITYTDTKEGLVITDVKERIIS